MPPQRAATSREPLPDPLDFQQAGGSSQTPRNSYRQPSPLMDLSSLEGPPIDDQSTMRTPHSIIPRLRVDNATPHNTPPNLLWKPLPPRPASAEPISPRQQEHRRPAANPTGNDGPSSRDNNLIRASAHRGRHTEEDELEHNRVSPDYERSRSSTIIQRQTNQPRSRSSDPRVWLEDVEQWTTVGSSATRSSHPQIHRLPTRLRNATTPLYVGHPYDSDDDLERRDHPPDYESHCFSPNHVMRLTFGPASRPRASAHENSQ
ncbi:uncharacterized protein N7498_001117 [Penicillium cinerascens]|uniref:Uncharacterized protein n=1 Tax=Penicillium cinerascens TaxID=70096 RepID=A0A9W9TDR1_9EURO|nr:uncharacterized protein N7498_001117 [Penicillium cinerascens]KAJ5219018.1 hypothetical protein N7498_001117 [Penicillium cinerascens]